MKTLQNFKKEKVELKSINGGKLDGNSGGVIWSMPGGAETEGNYISALSGDDGSFTSIEWIYELTL